MTSLPPELRQLIAKVAKENGIVNFTEEISKTVAKEGEGYIGIIEALNITDEETERQLNLVIKRAPSNEALRKQFPTRVTFLREIFFYNEVIPGLKSFQEKFKVPDPFNNTANLYGFVEDEFKEVLLLQNLKLDGFSTCNRREPMDSHHLALGLTTYAKLHAISHAMKRLEPETFKKITANIKGHVMMDFAGSNSLTESKFDDLKLKAMLGAFFQPAFQALKDNAKLTETLQRVKEHLIRRVLDISTENLHKADAEFNVVAHADCWSANLMFKYQNTSNPKIPTDVKLIDWQTSFLTHPMLDISYFLLINSAKPDLENYLNYLKIYYEALSTNLSAFGVDVDSFYSFELLEEQWRKFAFIGFQMCLVMLHQSLSESKTHDFEKMAKEGQDVFDMSKREIIINDLFKQRMTDLVEFLDNNQLI